MKKLVVLFLIFIAYNAKSQDNLFSSDRELSYKQEESYKTFEFTVLLDNQSDIEKLKILLKSNTSVFFVDYNSITKKCIVDTDVNFEKADLVNITGPAGFKISDISRKVTLMVTVPSNKDIDFEKIESDRKAINYVYENWPTDFPKFIDTGNPLQDNIDYAKRKDLWIENNPEKYKKLTSNPYTYETDSEKAIKAEKSKNIN